VKGKIRFDHVALRPFVESVSGPTRQRHSPAYLADQFLEQVDQIPTPRQDRWAPVDVGVGMDLVLHERAAAHPA
jgi:hypothetical protein